MMATLPKIEVSDHLVYLANPYSHRQRKVEVQRFKAVEKLAAALLKQGYHIYSPIVHCHAISNRYGIPTDAKYWERYNTSILRRCTSLFVYQLRGWDKSVGVQHEVETALKHGIPVFYLPENIIGELMPHPHKNRPRKGRRKVGSKKREAASRGSANKRK